MKTLLVIQTATLATKRRMNLEGVIRAADEIGWRVQTLDSVPTQRQLEKLVEFWEPVGLIIEGSGLKTAYRVPTSVPTVYLDIEPAMTGTVSCIRNDSAYIGELIAREFLSLGLKRFAFVGWHRKVYWCEEKLEAFARILALHGAAISEFRPTVREATNQIALQKRLRTWMRSLPAPCGVFAINDSVAEQVLAAAGVEGIAVPERLAVIGVDNDESICERTHPTLTSVMPNFAETGYQAVCTLYRQDHETVRQTIRPLALVRRQSTRILGKSDAHVNAALERIRREACSGLSAKDVLSVFPYSRRLAEKRFRELTGESVLKAIHRTRLAYAQELLRNPDIPIKVVANRCGWNSDIIFRRIYKSEFGTAPRQASHRATPQLRNNAISQEIDTHAQNGNIWVSRERANIGPNSPTAFPQ